MAQMMELIKTNAVPAAVMRSAAKGALSVPPAEMLQILVHLTHNPVFAEEAVMTLARWDQASALAVLSTSDPPQEVVDYFLDPKNQRPGLMRTLIENQRVSEQRLIELGKGAPSELIQLMLSSPRVKNMRPVLETLLNNLRISDQGANQIREWLGVKAEPQEPVDPESEAVHNAWKQEHLAEIQAEEGTAFELMGAPDEVDEAPAIPAVEKTAPAAQPGKPAVLSSALRVSTVVKLSRMNVAERVKRGFLGDKEERTILIRDGARIVQNAVLASPKLSESEVETFAAAKNVSENVLREIARGRRFIKNYAVVRSLANNPRCPLDLSLTLVKSLLVMDLKNLQNNKNVPETLRKVASKLFKEKSTPVGQKPDY